MYRDNHRPSVVSFNLKASQTLPFWTLSPLHVRHQFITNHRILPTRHNKCQGPRIYHLKSTANKTGRQMPPSSH